MSKYKIIEVVKTSGNETQSIYDSDIKNDAIAKMHLDFGAAVSNKDTIAAYCVVIDQEAESEDDIEVGNKSWVISTPYDATDGPDPSIRDRVYTHNDYTDDNISPYDTEKLAIANYNTKIGNAMNKSECNYALTIRFDNSGVIKESNIFIRDKNEDEKA